MFLVNSCCMSLMSAYTFLLYYYFVILSPVNLSVFKLVRKSSFQCSNYAFMCTCLCTGAVAKAILRSGGEVVKRECEHGN